MTVAKCCENGEVEATMSTLGSPVNMGVTLWTHCLQSNILNGTVSKLGQSNIDVTLLTEDVYWDSQRSYRIGSTA